MRHTFVQLSPFAAKARKLGLDHDDIRLIELAIMEDPDAWPVMSGTNGLRKMRYAPRASGAGKSGGIRVCYFVIVDAQRIYLATAYGKNEMDNLSRAERNSIAKYIALVKSQFRSEQS